MQNLVEAGMNDDSIMVYDLTEYVSMSLGFAVVRNDSKMIDSVNQAYCTARNRYCKPENEKTLTSFALTRTIQFYKLYTTRKSSLTLRLTRST